MRKSYISLVGLISIMLAGCGNSNDLMSQNETLKAQVESLSYKKESGYYNRMQRYAGRYGCKQIRRTVYE